MLKIIQPFDCVFPPVIPEFSAVKFHNRATQFERVSFIQCSIIDFLLIWKCIFQKYILKIHCSDVLSCVLWTDWMERFQMTYRESILALFDISELCSFQAWIFQHTFVVCFIQNCSTKKQSTSITTKICFDIF